MHLVTCFRATAVLLSPAGGPDGARERDPPEGQQSQLQQLRLRHSQEEVAAGPRQRGAQPGQEVLLHALRFQGGEEDLAG